MSTKLKSHQTKPSTSRKSGSVYIKLPKLKRTLKRKPKYREINIEDFKYLWAAYKLGKLGFVPEGLNPPEFDEAILSIINSEFDYAWTFLEQGSPIGFIFGSRAMHFVVLGGLIWVKASARQRLEHVVNLANDLRKVMKFIFLVEQKDNDFYLHVAKHGIMRRVGHINDLTEKPQIQFESRSV